MLGRPEIRRIVSGKGSGIPNVIQVKPNGLLEVLEGLFDFYFVEPAKSQQRRDALNQKLTGGRQVSAQNAVAAIRPGGVGSSTSSMIGAPLSRRRSRQYWDG